MSGDGLGRPSAEWTQPLIELLHHHRTADGECPRAVRIIPGGVGDNAVIRPDADNHLAGILKKALKEWTDVGRVGARLVPLPTHTEHYLLGVPEDSDRTEQERCVQQITRAATDTLPRMWGVERVRLDTVPLWAGPVTTCQLLAQGQSGYLWKSEYRSDPITDYIATHFNGNTPIVLQTEAEKDHSGEYRVRVLAGLYRTADQILHDGGLVDALQSSFNRDLADAYNTEWITSTFDRVQNSDWTVTSDIQDRHQVLRLPSDASQDAVQRAVDIRDQVFRLGKRHRRLIGPLPNDHRSAHGVPRPATPWIVAQKLWPLCRLHAGRPGGAPWETTDWFGPPRVYTEEIIQDAPGTAQELGYGGVGPEPDLSRQIWDPSLSQLGDASVDPALIDEPTLTENEATQARFLIEVLDALGYDVNSVRAPNAAPIPVVHQSTRPRRRDDQFLVSVPEPTERQPGIIAAATFAAHAQEPITFVTLTEDEVTELAETLLAPIRDSTEEYAYPYLIPNRYFIDNGYVPVVPPKYADAEWKVTRDGTLQYGIEDPLLTCGSTTDAPVEAEKQVGKCWVSDTEDEPEVRIQMLNGELDRFSNLDDAGEYFSPIPVPAVPPDPVLLSERTQIYYSTENEFAQYRHTHDGLEHRPSERPHPALLKKFLARYTRVVSDKSIPVKSAIESAAKYLRTHTKCQYSAADIALGLVEAQHDRLDKSRTTSDKQRIPWCEWIVPPHLAPTLAERWAGYPEDDQVHAWARALAGDD